MQKYKAKKTEYDGIMFDSKKEAQRYAESENEVYKKNEGYKTPDNINLDFEPVDDDDLPF